MIILTLRQEGFKEETSTKAELSWIRSWVVLLLSLDLVTDARVRAVEMRFFLAASCRAA